MQSYRYYSVHVVNYTDKELNIYINPMNGEAKFSSEFIKSKVDNFEVLNKEGVNIVDIAVYDDGWHIFGIGGYNWNDGLFMDSF